VVAGGETSGAVVDHLGIPAFLVGPEIAAGVPVLRTIGGRGAKMLLALKSGNFGGADFLHQGIGTDGVKRPSDRNDDGRIVGDERKPLDYLPADNPARKRGEGDGSR